MSRKHPRTEEEETSPANLTASSSSFALATAPVSALTRFDESIAELTASVGVLQTELEKARVRKDYWLDQYDQQARLGSISPITQSACDRHQQEFNLAQTALTAQKELLTREKELLTKEKELLDRDKQRQHDLVRNVRSLKVLRRLDAQSEGVGLFVFNEFGSSYTSIFAPGLHTVDLKSQHLFGYTPAPSHLLVRQCYSGLSDSVQKEIFTNGKTVFVAGTRGIGKSVFGLLMALKWAEEGHAVLYEHKGAYLLLLRETFKDFDEINFVLSKEGYAPLKSQEGVFMFGSNDSDLFARFSKRELFVHVQDLGDNFRASAQLDGNAKRLLISSPNNANLETFNRLMVQTSVIVMPLWTLDELELARGLCFPELTPDEVATRFEVLGGTPRMVLEANFETAKGVLEQQLTLLDGKTLRDIMTSVTYFDLPHQKNTGLLIHVEAAKASRSFQCQFASKLISRRLAEKFLFQVDQDFQVFISKASDLPAFAAWRGYMLEVLTHRVLGGHEKAPVKLLKLDPETDPADESTFEFGFEEMVHFDNLAKITIKANTYYQPTASNYPTIDSFAVMDQESALKCFPSTKVVEMEYFVVLFQVTVSPKHVMSGTVLNEHLVKVKTDLPSDSVGMIIVFVTSETSGVTRPMVATRIAPDDSAQAANARAKGGKAAQVLAPFIDQAPFSRQFAMHIGFKFEKLTEQWKNAALEGEEEL